MTRGMNSFKSACLVLLGLVILYTLFSGFSVVSSCASSSSVPFEENSGPIVHPKTLFNNNSVGLIDNPTPSTIGLAFVLVVHNLKTIKAALMVIQLLQSDRCFFVIHIDKKVPQDDIKYLTDTIATKHLKNIEIMSTQAIKWGGKELLPVSLDGMALALDKWPNWHYLFLMSGDCLPIKPLDRIQQQMAEFWPKNNLAINGESMESRDQTGSSKKLRFKMAKDETFDDIMKGLKMVYYGTTWVTLTRPFVHWIRTSNFARNFLLLLNSRHLDWDPETSLPSIFEELYFQTAIMHSPFADDVGTRKDCIRFEKWGGCHYNHEDRPVPCMLGEKDVPEFEKTNCLFARKFVYNSVPTLITDRLKD